MNRKHAGYSVTKKKPPTHLTCGTILIVKYILTDMKYKEENNIPDRLYEILGPQMKNDKQNSTIFKANQFI